MQDYKKKTIIALKKANTLTGKIIEMLEEDKYCIEVIQQNLAVIGLLKSANLKLLQGHFNCCVKSAMKGKDEKKIDEMMEELLEVVRVAQSK